MFSAWDLIRGVGNSKTSPSSPGASACFSVKMEGPRTFQSRLGSSLKALAVHLGELGF